MNYGCIARKLGHSFSKTIHGRIDSYDYQLRELMPEELDAFMRAKDFQGINVTIPYKESVLPYLDHISDTARAIGAVNTVVNRSGELWGFNTDFGGMRALIRHMGLDLTGRKVLILGSGGTSKTARAAAGSLGASEIVTVSRRPGEHAVSYETAAACHSDGEMIINTTPCGMFPEIDRQPIGLDAFPRLEGVVDAVFNPLASRLVLDARRRGMKAQGGLYMLVAQAVLAAHLFTGKEYPADLTDRIYRELLAEKKNLVLIGMPGSGKTTVGRLLAQRLNRPFVDLDAQIAARDGRSIPEIFAQSGEDTFRTLETACVREVAVQNGLVIATGGGSILREENVRLLKQNGELIFLDRPPESLCPTDDRPLSDTMEKMHLLYEQRLPLYRAAADRIVAVNGEAKTVAERIASDENGEWIR
ncbi:MAG: AAA family ATPase [Oscillospiraceae bacterium]|nr:AAA family ATPase [Oscillospiraceae bacterium]